MPRRNAYQSPRGEPVLSLSQLLNLKQPEPLTVTLARRGLIDLPEEAPTLEQVFPAVGREGRDKVTPELLAETGPKDLTSHYLEKAKPKQIRGREYRKDTRLPSSDIAIQGNSSVYVPVHVKQLHPLPQYQPVMVPSIPVWPQVAPISVALPQSTPSIQIVRSIIDHRHSASGFASQQSVRVLQPVGHVPVLMQGYSPITQLALAQVNVHHLGCEGKLGWYGPQRRFLLILINRCSFLTSKSLCTDDKQCYLKILIRSNKLITSKNLY